MARVPSKRATSTFISWRCARRSTSMAKATAMWSQFPAAAIGRPVWPTIVMSAAKPQTRLTGPLLDALQRGACCPQILGIEALGEPTVYRSEQFGGCLTLTALGP